MWISLFFFSAILVSVMMMVLCLRSKYGIQHIDSRHMAGLFISIWMHLILSPNMWTDETCYASVIVEYTDWRNIHITHAYCVYIIHTYKRGDRVRARDGLNVYILIRWFKCMNGYEWFEFCLEVCRQLMIKSEIVGIPDFTHFNYFYDQKLLK